VLSCRYFCKHVIRSEGKMVRTQIQLTEEQSRVLKAIALEKGISVAELIRRCIDKYIQSTGQLTSNERRQRALSIVGQFAAEETDLSTDHDRYLAEVYGDDNE
jgi:predicted DNA-binding ribbon-helix-helix protein